jgi:hypothetical protein
LVDLVLDAATRDEYTARWLAAQNPADRVTVRDLDPRRWRSAITAAFGPKSRFIDYRHAPEWAYGITEILTELEQWTNSTSAGDVMRLMEHAFARAEMAIGHVDDSDGWITMIADQIGDIHLAACRLARPSPVKLARRLADFDLTAELDVFRGAAHTYAEVLGTEGLGEYHRVVGEAAERLARAPQERWSSEVFHLRLAQIGLAQAGGDVEGLITILTAGPMLPSDHLLIVNLLIDQQRVDEAVAWAERGLDTSSHRVHQMGELRERLIAILLGQGDEDGARRIRREGFRASPSPTGLRELLAAHSASERSAARLEQLHWLEVRVEENPIASHIDEYLRILLSEGEIDLALEKAKQYGCTSDVRRTLARAIESSHPRDAIALHQSHVDELIDQKKRASYEAAARILQRINRLFDQLDDAEGWSAYLNDVMTAHKAKSSLQAILRAKDFGATRP